jgi:hypothetical protein
MEILILVAIGPFFSKHMQAKKTMSWIKHLGKLLFRKNLQAKERRNMGDGNYDVLKGFNSSQNVNSDFGWIFGIRMWNPNLHIT